MINSTIFSSDRKWRYTLWRDFTIGSCDMFSKPKPHAGQFTQFLCLNPSTADETIDDPTVRRCINFSKLWGYDGFCMTNIFAWRDTDPKGMMAQPDPVGCDNDMWISKIAKETGIIICAWGTHGKFMSRDKRIKEILVPFKDKVFCLGINSDGSPRHPLYISSFFKPKPFIID